jgi:hypothetical protein
MNNMAPDVIWRCDFCEWTGKRPAEGRTCPKCGESVYIPNYNVTTVFLSGGFRTVDFPGDYFELFPARSRP